MLLVLKYFLLYLVLSSLWGNLLLDIALSLGVHRVLLSSWGLASAAGRCRWTRYVEARVAGIQRARGDLGL
jgi:hypothetical protein